MTKLTRRAFLALIPVALAALFLLQRAFRHDPAEVIEAILRRRLEGLRLDPEGVRTYARECIDGMQHARTSLAWRAGYVLLPVYTSTSLLAHTPFAAALYDFEAKIVGRYLLCSNYFYDGQEPVRVVRKATELIGPCSNPFARATG